MMKMIKWIPTQEELATMKSELKDLVSFDERDYREMKEISTSDLKEWIDGCVEEYNTRDWDDLDDDAEEIICLLIQEFTNRTKKDYDKKINWMSK